MLDSLKLRVRDIREGGEDLDFVVSEDELRALLRSAEPGYETAGEVASARFRLSRTGENVFVHGSLHARVRYRCTRCLAENELLAQVEVDWSFLPTAAYQRAYDAEELELTAEDLDVSFYEGEHIDIADVLREVLALELDAFPTCRGDCRAPVGWQDSTAGFDDPAPSDEADSASIDPRWLPLAALKKKKKQN